MALKDKEQSPTLLLDLHLDHLIAKRLSQPLVSPPFQQTTIYSILVKFYAILSNSVPILFSCAQYCSTHT